MTAVVGGPTRHSPGTNTLFAQGFVELLLLRLMASEMSTNVTSVEASRRINPEQSGSLDRVDFDTAGQHRPPARRLTRLDADYYASLESAPTPSGPVPPAEDEAQRDSAWLRLLERAVGGWAPTLRGSLVLVALFLCAVVLLVLALGWTGLLVSGALAAISYWLNAAGRLPRA